MTIVHTEGLEDAAVGEIFACAHCLVATDNPEEVRIEGWERHPSHDGPFDPLLMVEGDDLLCWRCWYVSEGEK